MRSLVTPFGGTKAPPYSIGMLIVMGSSPTPHQYMSPTPPSLVCKIEPFGKLNFIRILIWQSLVHQERVQPEEGPLFNPFCQSCFQRGSNYILNGMKLKRNMKYFTENKIRFSLRKYVIVLWQVQIRKMAKAQQALHERNTKSLQDLVQHELEQKSLIFFIGTLNIYDQSLGKRGSRPKTNSIIKAEQVFLCVHLDWRWHPQLGPLLDVK